MILFLNFAPIEFMGGAEKWMLKMSSFISTREKTTLMDVDPTLSNIYGNAVLKRTFRDNSAKNNTTHLSKPFRLYIANLVPFTQQWRDTRKVLHDARIIYARYEFAEIFLLIYFGGMSAIHKTVAGLHLSILYEDPQGVFQTLHNLLYGSFIYKYFLQQAKLVHVINKRDEKFLTQTFSLSNVVYCPNGTEIEHHTSANRINSTVLHILYVGELSARKGTDTLIEIIKNAPDNFIFHIVGDGPLKDDIVSLNKKNCLYKGYLSAVDLKHCYSQCDVLLFPSRAEAFGLVMIEAMSYGLQVINAKEVALQLPSYIEHTANSRKAQEYLQLLNNALKAKIQFGTQLKTKIRTYCKENFSESVINEQFYNSFILANK